MRLKELIFVFGFILLISLISADACVVKGSCGAGEYAVMGLSSNANAHGQTKAAYDSNPYASVLCCDFGNGVQAGECSGTNEIIGLSSNTNAHGQTKNADTYSEDVCYEDLECVIVAPSHSACTGVGNIQTVSLSSITNAHIGEFSAYDVRICCFREGSPPIPECGDGDKNGEEDCDDGKQCTDGTDCTNDPSACTGIGDESCTTRNQDGCTVVCKSEKCGDGIITTDNTNGHYDDDPVPYPDPEQCDGVAHCTDCVCDDGFSPDGNGNCIEVLDEEVYWEKDGIKRITSAMVGDTVEMWWVDTGLASGVDIIFNVYTDLDDDGDNDDLIYTKGGQTSGVNGDVFVSWIIGLDHYYPSYTHEYIFNARTDDGSKTSDDSDILEVDIHDPIVEGCGKFNDDAIACNACRDNDCGEAVYSGNQKFEAQESDLKCGDQKTIGYCTFEVVCYCIYDEDAVENKCGSGWKWVKTGCTSGPELPDVGSCEYDDTTDGECDEGDLLEVSWTAVFTWGEGNDGWFDAATGAAELEIGEENFVEDYRDDLWYFDPFGGFATCQAGEDIIPCPSTLGLPFFSFGNVIFSLIFIELIYVFLIFKKSKKR